MKKQIEIEKWNRKEYFAFFSTFDEPFFCLNANVECTKLFNEAKTRGESLFLKYVHAIMTAINQIDEFKYRIEDDEVYLYDTIHVSSTIGRADGSFGFSFIEYHDDFQTFSVEAQKEIHRVKSGSGLMLNDLTNRMDVIHFSALPWIQFTALSHPRDFKHKDSCPKISTGKIFEENKKMLMPLSVFVHHGFADGLHVGKLLQNIQKLF